ncbi:uncharacterized protein TNCT_377981 [Trichonephila clavata]|uniref:Uncharacterized protein n=1 Tax=Trichonephila clavata TaxID=2740835 RepID=A0A8X6GQX2_TRICU|nr:uncharacterized protein TNCT_392121 [Trichonephila clavata]GFR29728.1 uncharacterized protein TNCT_377981 [Trichonephila clavata]
MPFKSFEFESIDDQLRTDGMYGQYARSTYPRRSSLSDTPLTSKAVDSPAMRRYNRDMASELHIRLSPPSTHSLPLLAN